MGSEGSDFVQLPKNRVVKVKAFSRKTSRFLRVRIIPLPELDPGHDPNAPHPIIHWVETNPPSTGSHLFGEVILVAAQDRECGEQGHGKAHQYFPVGVTIEASETQRDDWVQLDTQVIASKPGELPVRVISPDAGEAMVTFS